MFLKPRQDFYKVPAGEPNFRLKLRSKACDLGPQNVYQNKLHRKSCYEMSKKKVSGGVYILKISRMYLFTGALQNSCFTFSNFFKLVNENTESIGKDLCNAQTLKSSPTCCLI